MSRTPHPGTLTLLRTDGMASALLVTLSWFSAIVLAGHVSPAVLVATVVISIGVAALSHPPTRAALAARLAVLTVPSTPPPEPARPRPPRVTPPPSIALRAVRTVRRTRAPGVACATA